MAPDRGKKRCDNVFPCWALGEILEDTATFIDPENQNQINQEVINLLKRNRSQELPKAL